MATRGTWRQRGLAIVAATTVIGSFTIWATQVAIATPATAATVQANPYFAGAVTTPPAMKQKLGEEEGSCIPSRAGVRFVVPTVTCSATQDTPYTIFQNLEGEPGESGFAALFLDCTSGTLSAAMLTYANTGNGSSGGCDDVAVNPGDSISFSEQDSVDVQRGLIPTGSSTCKHPTARTENPPSALANDPPALWACLHRHLRLVTHDRTDPPNAPPSPADPNMRFNQGPCLRPICPLQTEGG